MTRDEIMALSGRALDEAVAERVYRVTVTNGYYWMRQDIPCPDDREGCCVRHDALVPMPVRPYSSQVWLAFEAAEEAGVFRKHGLILCQQPDTTWLVGEMDDDDWSRSVLGATAAEALCRACLLALSQSGK